MLQATGPAGVLGAEQSGADPGHSGGGAVIDAIWEFLRSIENTEFSIYLREGDLGTQLYLPIFYLLLAVHSIGMAIVVGICFMLTGRMYGYVQTLPLSLIPRMINFAWWGFGVNAVSGVLLFVAQPRREIRNWAFDLKIVMILIAAVLMAVMVRALREGSQRASPAGASVGAMAVTEPIPSRARTAALWISIMWIGAILTGRIIAYTQGPPPA